MNKITLFNKGILFVLVAISLASCAGSSGANDQARKMQIKEDYAATQNFKTGEIIKISIEEALALGIRNNMDARVSALEYLSAQDEITIEKLKALPSVEYSLSRTGRSNVGASSSLSVSTGLQSLEPSISSERYRTLQDLDVNWNLIDAATALIQSRSAENRSDIAAERHRKVLQNIRKDVYAGYWRVLADQQTKQQSKALLQRIEQHKKNLDKALADKLLSRQEIESIKFTLVQRQKEIESLEKENSVALIHLKSLLSLPHRSDVQLTSDNNDIKTSVLAALKVDAETLELTALEQRPEMREALIEQSISARDTRLEILSTIPGAELFFGLKNDTNRFLEDKQWTSFSAAIVQNITNLITLPSRYKKAKNLEELARARHLAKATAIMAQVHLARHGLIYAYNEYKTATENENSARYISYALQKSADAGRTSEHEALLKNIDYQIARISAQMAHAELQDKYTALLLSTGHDIGESISWKFMERSG